MNLQTGAKVVAVIPARFASTRFPGKMIEPLAGKPLVVHTYQRALSASSIEHVLIATDDSRVVNALKPYDIDVRMTRSDHLSGTDRIAEVAEILDADIVVNVQGDEPLIDPAAIDAAVQALLDDPEAAIATTRHAITGTLRHRRSERGESGDGSTGKGAVLFAQSDSIYSG